MTFFRLDLFSKRRGVHSTSKDGWLIRQWKFPGFLDGDFSILKKLFPVLLLELEDPPPKCSLPNIWLSIW